MLDKTHDLNVIEGGAGKTLPATREIGVRAVDPHEAPPEPPITLRRLAQPLTAQAPRPST